MSVTGAQIDGIGVGCCDVVDGGRLEDWGVVLERG